MQKELNIGFYVRYIFSIKKSLLPVRFSTNGIILVQTIFMDLSLNILPKVLMTQFV
jgi:hypothetical protein